MLAAVLVLSIWYVMLFVAQPDDIPAVTSAIETARYLLFEEKTSRHWFIWLAVFPFVLVAIGACYLAGMAKVRAFSIALLVLTVALGVSSFYLFNWSLAFL